MLHPTLRANRPCDPVPHSGGANAAIFSSESALQMRTLAVMQARDAAVAQW
jgi:hypothetical protein